jgi:FlgD Ig-like domain
MPWSAYSYLWSALVPEGYIVALPRTEGSLFPSHAEFGRDLAFVVLSLRTAGGDAGSPFFGHVAATAAVMGHSMGGGASVLAIAGTPGITAVANLAAAETDPSAIAAAVGVTAPALVFAGERDCVAPPATHQQPIYSALASACKTYVSVTGGSHCQFADANGTCSLGEAGCAALVSRTAQQATALRYLLPWLAWALKGDAAAWASFQSLRANDTAITSEQSCASLAVGPGNAARDAALRCAPNPASGPARIAFRMAEPGTARVEIFDLSGRRVRALVNATLQAGEHGVTWDGTRDDGRRASPGVYTVRVAACGRVESRTLAWLR